MKRIFILFVLMAFAIPVLGQTPNQVYLKNGSIIKGTIVEMDPLNVIKIQTSDGSLFVFQMAEIDHIVGAVTTDKNPGSVKIESFRKIDRHGGDFYWDDTDEKLTPEECFSILRNGDIYDNLYETYKSAQVQFNNGRSLIFTGITFALAAIVSYSLYLDSGYSYESPNSFGYGSIRKYEYDTKKLTMFYVSSIAADLCFFSGFLFKGIGKGRLEWVKDTYNSGRSQASAIRFAPSLMMTAQNDLGLGVSLNLSF